MSPNPAVATLVMYTCPEPVMDVELIHFEGAPSILLPSSRKAPPTISGLLTMKWSAAAATYSSFTMALNPEMASMLFNWTEMEGAFKATSEQLAPPTLTLRNSTDALLINRLVPENRCIVDGAASMYTPNVPPVLTLK